MAATDRQENLMRLKKSTVTIHGTPAVNSANTGKTFKVHGWTFQSNKLPIYNSSELENAAKYIQVPFPEMFFGNNSLQLESPKNVAISFNALDALAMVLNTADAANRIKVKMAESWTNASLQSHTQIKEVIKPYDWTYTTLYKGTLSKDKFVPSQRAINIEKLLKPDPILFYDHVHLYEDELGDNGSGDLSIRIRVMNDFFLVLQRFFLRVDGVLIKTIDTRLYHEFNSNVILRDFEIKEISHDIIAKKLIPGVDDPSRLADMNWVASQMDASCVVEKITEEMEV
ncbi:TIP41-like family-domain-containing protein [Globomyces pollinis-pini]|nr:TIP41-like family-domain-containing protein [Globomyces pollinis-pini]